MSPLDEADNADVRNARDLEIFREILRGTIIFYPRRAFLLISIERLDSRS